MDSPELAWLLFCILGIIGWPLALTWILTRCHIRVARDFGLIDKPSERKFHKQPTPTSAGVALYLGITCFAFANHDSRLWSPQLLFAGLIVIVGLLDDIRPVPAQLRLVIHGIITWPAVLLAIPSAGWELQAVGCLWVLVLIHAFNFIDNMDGLCAGVAWVLTACLAAAYWIAAESGVLEGKWGLDFSHLLMLIGGLTAFLWFNRPPARVFMGDAGSTFLGFFLGVASLPLFFGADGPPHLSAEWLAPLCMFALPIYDLVSVATLRVWQRRGLFVSDRNNVSHRLVALGFTPTRAVLLLWLLAVVGGVGGLLLYVVSNPMKTIVGVAQLLGWWVGLPVVEWIVARKRV
jgi:UDP-GlcNAc:undecaprenyl-phosphate GlcNAc-1-phosphate transferase